MKRHLLSLLVLLLFAFFSVPQTLFAETSPDDICGQWYTKDSDALVEIFKEGETYAGKIVWLSEKSALDDDGKPVVDANNPDPTLTAKPIVGLKLAHGFMHEGGNDWEGGFIYDPDNGKTYKCLMELKKEGKQLKVKGFIGISLLGRSEYWTRKEL